MPGPLKGVCSRTEAGAQVIVGRAAGTAVGNGVVGIGVGAGIVGVGVKVGAGVGMNVGVGVRIGAGVGFKTTCGTCTGAGPAGVEVDVGSGGTHPKLKMITKIKHASLAIFLLVKGQQNLTSAILA